jgi:hypothetical protein
VKWRRLAIRGYRSIADADLRLGEITVIIGQSDTGKSNVVRALRDWGFNAKGDAMISAGGSVARVAVVLEDGHVVAWEHRNDAYGKGGAGSSYYVRHKGETIEHRKIGVTVPTEVSDLTTVRELEADKETTVRVQFAEQGDPWFLLASPPWTPGTVTKVVGKIAGLDTLILANRALERDRIDAGRRQKGHLQAAADQRRALGEYAGLDRARELVAKAGTALERAKGLRRRIDEARALAARMKARKEAAARARAEVAELRPAVARAEELGLLELLESESRVDQAMADINRSLAVEKEAIMRLGRAKDEVRAAKAELKKLAKDGELICATCGGPIHDECREALALEAARDA